MDWEARRPRELPSLTLLNLALSEDKPIFELGVKLIPSVCFSIVSEYALLFPDAPSVRNGRDSWLRPETLEFLFKWAAWFQGVPFVSIPAGFGKKRELHFQLEGRDHLNLGQKHALYPTVDLDAPSVTVLKTAISVRLFFSLIWRHFTDGKELNALAPGMPPIVVLNKTLEWRGSNGGRDLILRKSCCPSKAPSLDFLISKEHDKAAGFLGFLAFPSLPINREVRVVDKKSEFSDTALYKAPLFYQLFRQMNAAMRATLVSTRIADLPPAPIKLQPNDPTLILSRLNVPFAPLSFSWAARGKDEFQSKPLVPLEKHCYATFMAAEVIPESS